MLSQANWLWTLVCKNTRPGEWRQYNSHLSLGKKGSEILMYVILKYFRATVSVSTLKQASDVLSDYITLVACPVTPDESTNSFSDNAFFGFISATIILKHTKTCQLVCYGACHLCSIC